MSGEHFLAFSIGLFIGVIVIKIIREIGRL